MNARPDPSKPLVLDLGCGAGRSLLLAAHGDPSGRNYLGIEIRRQLAARANEWARLCGLSDR